jgi:hypothetical protein
VVSDQAPAPVSTTTGGVITGGPQVSCIPRYDSFPPTGDGSTSTIPVYCTNIGSAASGVNLTIDINGTDSNVFSAQFGQFGFPVGGLSPNQSVEIVTTYSPTIISKDQSFLTLLTNAGSVVIPLFGEGINATCELQIPTEALDFGPVPVGTTAQAVNFTILNIGSSYCEIEGPLSIQNDPSGSFHIVSTNIQPDMNEAYIVPNNGTGVSSGLAVTVDFKPTEVGSLAAQVGDFISLTGVGQASP